MMPSLPPTPRWMTAIIIVLLLPVFQFPLLLADTPDVAVIKALVWIYPVYCLVAAYLAWQCYPQRHALSWILLGLMLLSHIAIWLLVSTPITEYSV